MIRHFFLVIFGLLALVGLTSCVSFLSSRETPLDKTGWITHCFGRFLIDLPPNAEVRAGYYLWGSGIKEMNIDNPAELAAVIDKREQELKTQRHRTIPESMFLRRLDLGGGATGLLYWASDASTVMQYLDIYAITKPTWRAYYWRVKLSPGKETRAIELLNPLVRSLYSREPDEIPSEPGFCMDRAYIAGDSFQTERFGVGVTFPDHPGVDFEFRSSTGAAQKSLLERVGGFIQGSLSLVIGIETLRKGKRPVGALPGEEYLVAGSQKGQRAYTFTWDVQGKDESLTEPRITAGLAVLERDDDDDGNPPPPAFKSDKEALALWDAIIDSIRLRPVSSGRDGYTGNPSNPVPPTGSIGGSPAMEDDHALEEFLAELKPKDNWMDDL